MHVFLYCSHDERDQHDIACSHELRDEPLNATLLAYCQEMYLQLHTLVAHAWRMLAQAACFSESTGSRTLVARPISKACVPALLILLLTVGLRACTAHKSHQRMLIIVSILATNALLPIPPVQGPCRCVRHVKTSAHCTACLSKNADFLLMITFNA